MHAARCGAQADTSGPQQQITSEQLYANLQAVLFFWASWSAPCKHMQQVLETLAKQHPSVAYLQVCHSTKTPQPRVRRRLLLLLLLLGLNRHMCLFAG